MIEALGLFGVLGVGVVLIIVVGIAYLLHINGITGEI